MALRLPGLGGYLCHISIFNSARLRMRECGTTAFVSHLCARAAECELHLNSLDMAQRNPEGCLIHYEETLYTQPWT